MKQNCLPENQSYELVGKSFKEDFILKQLELDNNISELEEAFCYRAIKNRRYWIPLGEMQFLLKRFGRIGFISLIRSSQSAFGFRRNAYWATVRGWMAQADSAANKKEL